LNKFSKSPSGRKIRSPFEKTTYTTTAKIREMKISLMILRDPNAYATPKNVMVAAAI
jgi:hypothetical protein